MLTQAILKENLHYNAETGIFTWINAEKPKTFGKRAGVVNGSGYVCITIDKKIYRASRLAWLYIYGEFPSIYVDHKDRVKTNNAIKNLRHATSSQNSMNKKMQSNNTSGFIGVHKLKNGTWQARAVKNKKRKFLGSFKTPGEASEKYKDYITKNRGEFAVAMWNETKEQKP